MHSHYYYFFKNSIVIYQWHERKNTKRKNMRAKFLFLKALSKFDTRY